MSIEGQVRRGVARYLWRSNPCSVELAAVAVEAARRMDAGDVGYGTRQVLRLAMSHLRSCEQEPDELDRLRVRVCRKMLPDEE